MFLCELLHAVFIYSAITFITFTLVYSKSAIYIILVILTDKNID